MRKKLIAGNWKMNGDLKGGAALLESLKSGLSGLSSEVAVCVPFPYLGMARDLLSGSSILWGAQTLSEHVSGAYTGEVSASMLGDFACTYVLVGHSERRALFGETNDLVAQKFAAACASGLKPILCLGETLAERQAGVTEAVVLRQLNAVVSRVGLRGIEEAVLAYEPVWAIGTGLTATPDQVQHVHSVIREALAAAGSVVRILYGGSVKPQNAAELFGQPDVDGGLIGGAALVADDFLAICRAAG